MNDKLLINTIITGDDAQIALEGVIDEDANFDKIKSLKMNKFVFDFDKVTLINSCGIREWIKYLKEIETATVTYINCPQIIIEQVNMVHGFIKKDTSVKSFYAPYFCEKCDTGKKILLNSNEVVNMLAPMKKCITCSGELEFDEIEKQYFSFLNQGK